MRIGALLPSPITPLGSAYPGLLVKRDDLIHPNLSGNKYRKLQCLESAPQDTVVTFGGPFSNHIHATAFACRYLHKNAIGFIRGYPSYATNSTLTFARQCGMQLHFLEPSAYRRRDNPAFLHELKERYQLEDAVWVPEGGSSPAAMAGVGPLVDEVMDQCPDVRSIVLPVGTGGTLAGIVKRLGEAYERYDVQVLGVNVVGRNAAESIETRILSLAGDAANTVTWSISNAYTFGGYARLSPRLVRFIQEMESSHAIPLEHVYSGKALFCTLDQLQHRSIPVPAVFIHCGGLQGKSVCKQEGPVSKLMFGAR